MPHSTGAEGFLGVLQTLASPIAAIGSQRVPKRLECGDTRAGSPGRGGLRL